MFDELGEARVARYGWTVTAHHLGSRDAGDRMIDFLLHFRQFGLDYDLVVGLVDVTGRRPGGERPVFLICFAGDILFTWARAKKEEGPALTLALPRPHKTIFHSSVSTAIATSVIVGISTA